MIVTVTIPDVQGDATKEAFAAQGFEASEKGVADALTKLAAQIVASYAVSQAARQASESARQRVASDFGLDPEALSPQRPQGGPGGPRREMQ